MTTSPAATHPSRVRNSEARPVGRRARVASAWLVVTVLVACLVVIAGHRDAYPTTKISVESGLAWVASEQIGSLTLLDGIAGREVTDVPVAWRSGDALATSQIGSAGFAVDQVVGTLARVDGSSLTARLSGHSPGGTGPGAAGLYAGGDVLYVVDGAEGVVVVDDTSTLRELGAPQRFGAAYSGYSAVVDGQGRLWVLDGATGRLTWFSSTAHGQGATGFTPGAVLTLADGLPVVTDVSQREAYLLDKSGLPGAPVSLAPVGAAGIQATGAGAGSTLLVTIGSRGMFETCHFPAGCGPAQRLGATGHTLGPAVLFGGRVFIPDYSTGGVLIVDPGGAGTPLVRALLPGPGQFALFVSEDVLFFNDPSSNVAGTVGADGSVRLILKYGQSAHSPSASPTPRVGPTATAPTTTARLSQSPTAAGTPVSPPASTRPPSESPSASPSAGASPTGTPSPIGPAGPPVALYDPESTGVYGIAYTPGGTLAVGDLNGSSYLWNVADAEVTETLPDGSGPGIFGITYSPQGTILAADTSNYPFYTMGSVVLWNTSTGKLITTLVDPGTRGVGNPVAFSLDGNTLAAPDDNGYIWLWNITTDEIIGTLEDPGQNGYYGLATSPSTGFLAVADGNGRAYLWNMQSGSTVSTFQDPNSQGIRSVAFSRDGNILATGDNNGNVYLWNVASGAMMATLYSNNGGTVQSIAFSSHSGILAATVDNDSDQKYAICMWNTTGKVLSVFYNPSSYGATKLAFSPDGDNLAVGDENAHTYIWNVSQIG